MQIPPIKGKLSLEWVISRTATRHSRSINRHGPSTSKPPPSADRRRST